MNLYESAERIEQLTPNSEALKRVNERAWPAIEQVGVELATPVDDADEDLRRAVEIVCAVRINASLKIKVADRFERGEILDERGQPYSDVPEDVLDREWATALAEVRTEMIAAQERFRVWLEERDKQSAATGDISA